MEREQFETCWDDTMPRVLAYARRHVNGDEAYDVVSATYLTAWRTWDAVPDHALPWLLSTAHGHIRNHLRSRRRQFQLADRIELLGSTAATPTTPPSLHTYATKPSRHSHPNRIALAVSMPVAGLVATVVVGPSVLPRMTPEILLIGVGLAILLPVVPFALELLALRRLTTAAFGTAEMALEPAFAMIVGLVVHHQDPGPAGIVGICFRGGRAGIGAARTGARSSPVPVEVG